MNQQTKQCSTCPETKPVAEFYKASKGGYAHQCKKCVSEKRKKTEATRYKIEYFNTNEQRKTWLKSYGEWRVF